MNLWMGGRQMKTNGEKMEETQIQSNDGYTLCIYNGYLRCEQCGECDSPKTFTVKEYDSQGNMTLKEVEYLI